MTSPLLALLLTGCAPQNAEVDGTWHVWLAANNSPTVNEGELDLVERSKRIYECKRGWDEDRGDFEIGYVGPRTADERNSGKYFGGACDPADSSCDQAALEAQCTLVNDAEYYTFLQDDGYYYLTEPIDTWRSEALINGEGDFQLTLHNRLGNGQDYRIAFSIDPDFAPQECVDMDGDGTASAEYVDGADWKEQWSVDQDGYTVYYLNAGAYQVDPTSNLNGPASNDEPEFWYFTSEWSAGFSHSKFAAEEFVGRPTDYGRYDESGFGTDFDLIYGLRPQCGADRDGVPPLVNAGSNAFLMAGETITLDGTGTVDPDGDALTWLWSIQSAPTGSDASLLVETPTAEFTPDLPGSYSISLTVYDGAWTRTDTINVTAGDPNHVPSCDAVADMQVEEGSVASLDASGTDDVDGDLLAWHWVIQPPTGPVIELPAVEGDPDPGPVVDQLIDQVGTWTVQVDATDPSGKSCVSTFSVEAVPPGPVTDAVPLCDAGVDLEATYGDEVALNLGDATDPDGGPMSFAWSVASAPGGSLAVVDQPGSNNPAGSFTPDKSGNYVLALTATDNEGDTCSSSLNLTVRNSAPLCDTGGHRYFAPGEALELSDQSQVDPDGNPVTASWTLTSAPLCSTATLTDNGDGTASVSRDLNSFYELQYTLSDGDKSCTRAVSVVSTCDEHYEAGYTCHQADAERWALEMSHLAVEGVGVDESLAGEPQFVHMTESNSWRPLDDQDAGVDGWAEVSSSWIRVADGSKLEEGGNASGDFQILLQGFESSSMMLVTGTFSVDKIRKDKWSYPYLEDELREQNGTEYCGGDTLD